MDRIDELLYEVEKPSRYIGNEVNSYMKLVGSETVRFGFAFPDVYEVGMSHLGSQILYNVLNEKDDVYCERIYSPWHDMEQVLRREKLPLFTLETRTDISTLDIIGFTLQYELSYTNILNILDLANIPLRSSDRGENDPIIIAGGPCAYNPEPMADVFDCYLMGEGEDQLPEFVEIYKKHKKNFNKEAFLLDVAENVGGVYVPSFYEVKYKEDNTIESVNPIKEQAPKTIVKRIMKDIDKAYYPEKFVVPYTDVVHDRAMIELFRGCTRGCRFCQAGMIYRPVREKSKERVESSITKLVENTGYEEISLTSLSTLDYTHIEDAVFGLINRFECDKVGLSLPSLRLDSFSVDILKEIQKIRKTGLTFAPEAGTQRMRDVINKNVNEEDLRTTMENIFALGWNRVKLYFMIGLPTETEEDLYGIVELANLVAYIHKKTQSEMKRSGLTVTVSTSSFVPKPFTPFQWMAQDTKETLIEKQNYLKSKLVNKKVKYNYHGSDTSYLEGVISRGDRRGF